MLEKYMMRLFTKISDLKIMLDINKKGLDYIAQNTGRCGIQVIDIGIDKEPYQIHSYFKTANQSDQQIMQYCTCDLIIIWNDFLDELITYTLKNMPDTANNLVAKITLKDLSTNFKESWISNYIRDYSFLEYKEKLRIAEKIMNKKIDQRYKEKLFDIIEVRNSIQHHNGIIDERSLSKLGKNKIKLYNIEGGIEEYGDNEHIKLSVPEIMSMRNCIVTCMATLLNENMKFELNSLSDIIPSKYDFLRNLNNEE